MFAKSWCGLSLFVGCLCYADDLALLAPSAGAFKKMLQVCSDFATERNLSFNTQLICFHLHNYWRCCWVLWGAVDLCWYCCSLGTHPVLQSWSLFCCSEVYVATVILSALWKLARPELHSLEVAFNKVLPRICNLPYRSHGASLQSIYNLVYIRCGRVLQVAKLSPSILVQHVFLSAWCFMSLVFRTTTFLVSDMLVLL